MDNRSKRNDFKKEIRFADFLFSDLHCQNRASSSSSSSSSVVVVVVVRRNKKNKTQPQS